MVTMVTQMGLSVEPKPTDDEGLNDDHVMSHDKGPGSSSSVGMATTPTATDNGMHLKY